MRQLDKATIIGLAISCGLMMTTAANANDGVDRYEGPTCTPLRLFDEPTTKAAGYRFLSRDFQGGADGDSAFRWAVDLGVALVRLSARKVAKTLGPGEYPMAIFDLSSENGDTPVSFSDSSAPQGRHPGGSHDGGWNLDLGYYLTSLDGREFTPDFAACTEHFSGEDDHPDAYQCMGPADRLDVDRQALLFLELIRIHHEDFGDGLIEEIGIDARVQESVMARLAQWVRSRRHRATPALVEELSRRMTSDLYEGWARSHHHHLHLRLQRINSLGPRRPEVESLLSRERDLDLELRESRGPALFTRIGSCGLQRGLELSILGADEVRSVEYRVGSGPWREPASVEGGFRHVEGLTSRPGRASTRVTVEARVTLSSGAQQQLRRTVTLPRQDPELWIAFRAGQVRVRAVRLPSDAVHLWLELPNAYSRLITRVGYELIPRQGQPIRGETTTSGSQARPYAVRVVVPHNRGEIVLARAMVQLSGRFEISLPFLIPVRSSEPELWD